MSLMHQYESMQLFYVQQNVRNQFIYALCGRLFSTFVPCDKNSRTNTGYLLECIRSLAGKPENNNFSAIYTKKLAIYVNLLLFKLVNSFVDISWNNNILQDKSVKNKNPNSSIPHNHNSKPKGQLWLHQKNKSSSNYHPTYKEVGML